MDGRHTKFYAYFVRFLVNVHLHVRGFPLSFICDRLYFFTWGLYKNGVETGRVQQYDVDSDSSDRFDIIFN